MVQNGTYLNVVDNSGAKDICCIQVAKGYRRRYAKIGEIITVSVKNIRKKKKLTAKIKKGDVTKALVVRTKAASNFRFNEQLTFKENAAVLLTKQKKLLGSRIFGGISKVFKLTRFLRILSVCSGTIR